MGSPGDPVNGGNYYEGVWRITYNYSTARGIGVICVYIYHDGVGEIKSEEIMLIKNKLYNGTVQMIFDSNRHRYTFNDKVIPTVTGILSIINKPALVNWSANIACDTIKSSWDPGKSYDELEIHAIIEAGRKAHFNKKVEAGNLGSFVHKWVEQYIKGENPTMPVNEELQDSIKRFLSWVEKHQVKFLASEQVIFSKRYKYAGTFDFICTMQGKPNLYMGDLKTSNGIYDEYFLQTSAYRYARHEEFPDERYTGQLIIRVGREGELEFAVIRDKITYQNMFRGFLAAQNLFLTMEALKSFTPEKE
jgi:hypothetical protein